MNRTILKLAIGITVAALLALLGYSLERTSWLFARFETDTALPIAAAVVVELAAVALIGGAGAIAQLDQAARAWANRALVAVLSVQALANLSAGYLRGGRATLVLFHLSGDGAGYWAAYAVAAALWLVVNLSVPALVLCLSKLLERLISALGVAPSADAEGIEETDTETTAPRMPLPSLLPALASAIESTNETEYMSFNTDGLAGNTSNTPAQDYVCRHCGASGLTKAQQLAHGRQRKRLGACGV